MFLAKASQHFGQFIADLDSQLPDRLVNYMNRPTEPIGIAITCNPLDHEGGVVSFYNLFLKKFTDNNFFLVQCAVGSRMQFFNYKILKILLYPMFFAKDLGFFIAKIIFNQRIKIVQVNPSLLPIPLIRDAIVIIIARLMRRKIVVFFHGWREELYSKIKVSPLLRYAFYLLYIRAEAKVVLAKKFKEELIALGDNSNRIYITSTMYDGDSVLISTDQHHGRIRFLFLARISKLKGVEELIEAAAILKNQGQDFFFQMVGHGDREGIIEHYQEAVEIKGLSDRFEYTGRLTGVEKAQAFANNDIYVLPSWTEGCPTTVLEALGSGLFVVSTNVGAVPEIIDANNGAIVNVRDPQGLAHALMSVCNNIDFIRKSRHKIMADATKKYEAQVIIEKFKSIYHEVLHG